VRITKDRETRRAELIEASAALFLDKGYESTMVSDIVKRVHVAQGTFYYYFNTKEDVLDAALEKMLQEGVGRASRLASDEFQTAVQRLEGLFRMLFSPRGSIDVSPRYSRFLQDPTVHGRMENVRFQLLCPVLKGLLECGIASGEFKQLRFPAELAEIALRGAAAFMGGRKPGVTSVGSDIAMDALGEFMEKMLGLPEHALDFKDIVIKRRA
jgi:AcrR family transcriptional regulator